MKLTKDQTQKLVLGVMMLGIVIYGYCEFLLGPLQREKAAAQQEYRDLQPKKQAALDQIKKTNDMKAKAPEAKLLVEQVKAMIPEGSPVAWFQPRVAEFFKGHQIAPVVAKMGSDTVEKDLPGFRRVIWGLEFPTMEFVPFAHAISDLENKEPLFELLGFDVEASRENVRLQRASVTVSNLVRL